jgi:hypothetical protein
VGRFNIQVVIELDSTKFASGTFGSASNNTSLSFIMPIDEVEEEAEDPEPPVDG